MDWERLFTFQRSKGLPSEVVKPVLDEFMSQFEELQIKEFLQDVLASINDAQPTMTMQDVAQLRRRLEEYQEIVSVKVRGIDGLFREFMLHKGTTLGAQCIEVIQFLRSLTSKMHSLDEAISQTDLELISQAVNDLEQSQLAIVRMETTIKAIAGTTDRDG